MKYPKITAVALACAMLPLCSQSSQPNFDHRELSIKNSENDKQIRISATLVDVFDPGLKIYTLVLIFKMLDDSSELKNSTDDPIIVHIYFPHFENIESIIGERLPDLSKRRREIGSESSFLKNSPIIDMTIRAIDPPVRVGGSRIHANAEIIESSITLIRF